VLKLLSIAHTRPVSSHARHQKEIFASLSGTSNTPSWPCAKSESTPSAPTTRACVCRARGSWDAHWCWVLTIPRSMPCVPKGDDPLARKDHVGRTKLCARRLLFPDGDAEYLADVLRVEGRSSVSWRDSRVSSQKLRSDSEGGGRRRRCPLPILRLGWLLNLTSFKST
jgi:hypothetical protein